MTETQRQTPPLSPVLLAGFVLRPFPLLPRPLLSLAMSAMRRRHPEVFGRLNSLGEAVFLIDPVSELYPEPGQMARASQVVVAALPLGNVISELSGLDSQFKCNT